MSLAKHLGDRIRLSGPLSVHQYIQHSLLHPLGGYYMKQDVFGTRGDFVTGPEISQLLGELLGVWFVSVHQKGMSKAPGTGNIPQAPKGSKFNLVELGPGRGTLMRDMLATIDTFPTVRDQLQSIHLVEASPFLKQLQANRLAPGKDRTSVPLYTAEGIPIHWHDTLDTVPRGTNYICAHEFFDALPVYKFEMTAYGWRELVVDVNEEREGDFIGNSESNGSSQSTQPSQTSATTQCNDSKDTLEAFKKFRLCIANKPTQPVQFFKHMLPAKAQVGDRIELSPETQRYTKLILDKMDKDSACLVVDYGKDHPSSDSLRVNHLTKGIKNHKFVDPFSDPGNVDLSVDVDFSLIRDTVRSMPECSFHGPLTQRDFLTQMGIAARVMMLLQKARGEQQKELVRGYERLIGDMGTVYKVCAITGKTEAPYPFHEK